MPDGPPDLSSLEVRLIDRSVDRASFSCGDDRLDSYLKERARSSQELGVAKTLVAVTGRYIWGFVTTTPAHLESERIPRLIRKSLPRTSLPVLRLARLGVQLEWQSEGIGRLLMKYAFEEAIDLADHHASVGVLVDAKPDSITYYADEYGFTELEPLEGEGQLLDLPETTALFLPLATVRAALRD